MQPPLSSSPLGIIITENRNGKQKIKMEIRKQKIDNQHLIGFTMQPPLSSNPLGIIITENRNGKKKEERRKNENKKTEN